jgi:D-glycero-beta-D-manno-heptose-7-phosphate kinase
MLSKFVEKFPQCRVLIIGDLIADEFVYGEISRVSREAPVMILRYERTETMPGGAGNAVSNVAALAKQASVIGIVGRDLPGRQLTLSLRNRGVNTKGIITVAKYQTPTKTRILAGSVHSTRQQVIRVDREPKEALPEHLINQLIERLTNSFDQIDAIIVSDYNYGVVTLSLLNELRKFLSQPSQRQIPIVVDSRFHLTNCYNFTAATPNQAELEAIAGKRLDTEKELLSVGEKLCQDLGLKVLLLTRGSEGMVIFQPSKDPYILPAIGSKDPVDVTGAGDTVIAAFTLALASGANFYQAAEIANHAGGIVVMKRGTSTLTQSELLASIDANLV